MRSVFRIVLFALIVAPGAARADVPFSVTVDTNTDLHYGLAVYTYDSSTSYDVVSDTSSPADMVMGSHTFGGTLRSNFDEVHYTYLGVYGTDGLSIALDQNVAADAIANQKDYFTVFEPNMDESELISNLKKVRSDDPIEAEEAIDGVNSFVRQVREFLPLVNRSTLVGDPGTLTKFSEATFGGSISGQPVPEPTSLVALGLGAVAVLRRRKRS